MPESSHSGSLPLESLKPDFKIHHSYPVHFTRNVFNLENPALSRALGLPREFLSGGGGATDVSGNDFGKSTEPKVSARALAILDDGLVSLNPEIPSLLADYFDLLRPYIQLESTLTLPGGESCKNDLSNLTRIYEAVARYGIDRHSYILAIGGGALIDVVGFAAATAHRGIRLIRIPTTVLAQNDASIGVKNGMNFAGRKNFIGSFAPPHAVINDFALLRTLSPEDRRAGMAEAVKVALIRDPAFFQWMEAHAGQLGRFEDWALQHLIVRCAELHLNQISGGGDPFESGSARPLDFGHWSAHKLEELSGHQLRHGEAVAIGMALDSVYSCRAGLLEEKQMMRVLSLLTDLGFSLYCPWLDELNVDQALQEFQEHLGGELCITLLDSCGTGLELNEIDGTIMKESLAWIKESYEKIGDVRGKSASQVSAKSKNGTSELKAAIHVSSESEKVP